jgi:DNA topoisomerase-3
MSLLSQVGVAFTRFQTRYFQGKYGNLDATVVSYGPCQTPTLNFCVERHQAITSFQPEPFWVVKPQVGVLMCNGCGGAGDAFDCAQSSR